MKQSLRTHSRHLLTLFTLLALCAGLFPASPAQAAIGTFAWAKSTGGIAEEKARGIAIDSAGNVYTTGSYQGTVDFDPGPGTYSLTSAGLSDIFVARLDSQGTFVWARSLGGILEDQGADIAVDAAGNVYTIGYYQGAADFDPGTGVANLSSAGLSDIFVSKLSSNGDYIWAGSMGGELDDEGNGLAVDTGGNVYTTGYYHGPADFDPGPGTVLMGGSGAADIFISKLDSNGGFLDGRAIIGRGFDIGRDITLDSAGNVYTIAIIGEISDIIIEKLTSNLDSVWESNIYGSALSDGSSIAVDASGNVYMTGFFTGTADFDPGAGVVNLTSAGLLDIFVSKLDGNGGLVWAKSMGGALDDQGESLAVDAAGDVYITGSSFGTADFDPGPGKALLSSLGENDIFVAKLNSDGDYARAWRLGGGGGDVGGDIAIDPAGDVYTTGSFQGTADFDPGPGTADLSSAGSFDIFVARFQQAAIFADVPPGYWALDFIERLYLAGITGGCATSPLRYCPEETVTRAQMAVFLLRGRHGSSYIPPGVGGSTGFGDVPTDYWAAAFIKQLAAEGITSGCGGGNYCPEQPVTRAQMAVFLLRSKYGAVYTPPAVGTGTGFGDVLPDYWAAAFIKQLVAEGITVGCGGGNYCPEQPVTRAQMAVFLVRTFGLP